VTVDPEHEKAPLPEAPSERQESARRTVLSRDLLQGQQEIMIEHDGEIYRLRQTKNGKLILQK
jgi:hemin uptake protein HemP